MSASRALQKAIYDKLSTDLAVPVYDGAPTDRVFPSIEIEESDFMPTDADCITSREETVTLHVWGRDQGKLHPTKAIVDDVFLSLHEANLTLDDPYACQLAYIFMARTFADPDGITAHGVVQVTAHVQTV